MQRGASVVYSDVADERITVMPLERAIEEVPELVEPYFGKRLPHDEAKFAAGTAAFWTGGVLRPRPEERPDREADPGGLADRRARHGPVGAHARRRGRHVGVQAARVLRRARLRGSGAPLGCVRALRPAGAQVNLAHYQDWGRGEVYDLSTRRVEIRRDARVKWVPIHLGGHLTKQTLDIITAEPGSDMRHSGLYFTERNEHLDLFTSDRHEAAHTTGDTVWKGALTGDSRASYEGLIHIIPKATEVDTYLQTHSMLLSPKAKGDAIPSLIVEVDNVKASHGGTVGELDPEQIFYMMTRGISRAEAVRVMVEGYFEEVVQRLDDPGSRISCAGASRRSFTAPRSRCASSSGSARRRPDGRDRRASARRRPGRLPGARTGCSTASASPISTRPRRHSARAR